MLRLVNSTALRTSFRSAGLRFYAVKKFTPEHEWISVENGIGTIGVTDYAQNALGEVVYAEVPSIGKKLSKKDAIGAVESVKAASDVYAPVSGEVVEANTELESNPSLINSSPEGDGWIAKVKISDPSELDSLLDASAYKEHVEKSS